MRSRNFRIALAAVAVVALCAAGLSRISFNVEILKLLPAHLRQVEGLSLFLKHFSLPEELIVTLEAADAEVAEAAADSLAGHLSAQPALVKRAMSRPPWEKQPAELAELLAFMVANQPPEKVSAQIAKTTAENSAATLKSSIETITDSLSPQEVAMLGYDPFGFSAAVAETGLFSGAQQSEFSSADGAFRVLYVESAQPLANYKEMNAWIARVKAAAAAWNSARPAQLTLGFTGEPAFVADISSTMEWDMSSSGLSTLVIVAAVFWLCYRRVKPLLWLSALLVVVFVVSLGVAGLFLSQLTVMGVGFASIMIGLSVDYGYLTWQLALTHTGTLAELRRVCFRNIVWTAGTTAAAFFALNMSSLPGLAQLGNLVAIGVLVGGAVMIVFFAPLAMRLRSGPPVPSIVERGLASPRVTRAGFLATLALVVTLLVVLAVKGTPGSDFSSNTLRPRKSDAYAALDRLQTRIAGNPDMLSVIVRGADESDVLAKLRAAGERLTTAQMRGDAASFRSTLPLWAATENQRENLPRLAALVADSARLRQAVLEAGFTEEAFGLTDAMLRHWSRWAAAPLPAWPGNEASAWILRRTARHADGNFLALGIVEPAPGREDVLAAAVESDGVWLVSWKRLGSELARVVPAEFARTFAVLVGIVLLLLVVAFRGLRDVSLLVLTMALVFATLAGAMSLLGMKWNLFNLAAILLLLGTGIDYSILLILALRANGGDIPDAQRQLGLVISLCAAAAAAGFGSISWANNLGLASLGQTCALGLALDALISIFLLPPAWRFVHGRAKK